MNPKTTLSRSLSLDWNKILSLGQTDKKVVVGKQPSITFDRNTVHFCTGSSYTGQWDKVGMNGVGIYELPHKVVYEGQMYDGMFHGEGTLTYPMGQKIEGVWERGKMVSWKYRFPDGMEYSVPWKFCRMPDRRFAVSMQEGLRPAGRELITADYNARHIPSLCYDTGDGFYNPVKKTVISIVASRGTLRIPSHAEEKWIIQNCRRALKGQVGYRPDLYEYWISGRKNEDSMKELLKKYDELEQKELAELELQRRKLSESSELTNLTNTTDISGYLTDGV